MVRRQGTDENWFTVPRAAELLGVPVTRVFDNIRDGRLRVRFRPGEDGGEERPMVTSDELQRKAGTGSKQPATATIKNGQSSALDLKKTESAKAEARPAEKPAPASGSTPNASSAQQDVVWRERLSERDRALDAERAARRTAEESLQREKARGKQLEETLAQELKSGDQLQRSVEKAEKSLQAEQASRQQIEKQLRQENKSREDAQQKEQKSAGELALIEKRYRDTSKELDRSRKAVEQAEDRLEESLKAVYERDVRVARLGAEVEAVQKVREQGKDYADRLQDRITRLEDRSEEKEKEIRRLALGLGEARGEIRLLRPPEEAASGGVRHFRKISPWLLALALAGFASWLCLSLARSSHSLEVSVTVGVGVVLAFGLGHLLRSGRRGA
jgi:hypothetical protein